MLKISKYIRKQGDFYINQFTQESVGNSQNVSELLHRLTQVNLNKDPSSNAEILDYILAYELMDRSILLPQEVENEEQYFNKNNPLKMQKSSFFNIPTSRWNSLPEDAKCAFIGIGSDLGSPKSGTDKGPSILRSASSNFTFRGNNKHSIVSIDDEVCPFLDFPAYDLGDFNIRRAGIDSWTEIIEQVYSKLPSHIIPITIGGDHSFTAPIINGLMKQKRKPFKILHIDHHLDLQSWGDFDADQPTHLDPLVHSNFISHIIREHGEIEIVQVGPRKYQSVDKDIHKPFFSYLKKIKKLISNDQFRVMSQEDLVGSVGQNQDVYLTIDVDAISNNYIPNTGYPSPTGIDYFKLIAFLKSVCQSNNIIGIDIMELSEDENARSRNSSCELINYLILDLVVSLNRGGHGK